MFRFKIVIAIILFLFIIPVSYSVKVTEISTECDLFSCKTILEFSDYQAKEKAPSELMSIDSVKKIDMKGSKKFIYGKSLTEKVGKIKEMEYRIDEKDGNRIIIEGKITPATANYWGIEGIWNSTWWNSSCTKRMNITCDGCFVGMPYLVNNSFQIGGNDTQWVWVKWTNTNESIYYDCSDPEYQNYTIANSTNRLPFEVESVNTIGSANSYNQADVWTGMEFKAVYHFNETDCKDSVTDFDLSDSGTEIVENGFYKSYFFNESETDFTNITNQIPNMETATIIGWINLNNVGDGDFHHFWRIFYDNSLYCYERDNGALRFYIKDSGGSGQWIDYSGARYISNEWLMLSQTYNRTHMCGYIDDYQVGCVYSDDNYDMDLQDSISSEQYPIQDSYITEMWILNESLAQNELLLIYNESIKGLKQQETYQENETEEEADYHQKLCYPEDSVRYGCPSITYISSTGSLSEGDCYNVDNNSLQYVSCSDSRADFKVGAGIYQGFTIQAVKPMRITSDGLQSGGGHSGSIPSDCVYLDWVKVGTTYDVWNGGCGLSNEGKYYKWKCNAKYGSPNICDDYEFWIQNQTANPYFSNTTLYWNEWSIYQDSLERNTDVVTGVPFTGGTPVYFDFNDFGVMRIDTGYQPVGFGMFRYPTFTAYSNILRLYTNPESNVPDNFTNRYEIAEHSTEIDNPNNTLPNVVIDGDIREIWLTYRYDDTYEPEISPYQDEHEIVVFNLTGVMGTGYVGAIKVVNKTNVRGGIPHEFDFYSALWTEEYNTYNLIGISPTNPYEGDTVKILYSSSSPSTTLMRYQYRPKDGNWSAFNTYSDSDLKQEHNAYIESVRFGTYRFAIGGEINGSYSENNNSDQFFTFRVGIVIPDTIINTITGQNVTPVCHECLGTNLGASESIGIGISAFAIILGMTVLAVISGRDRQSCLSNGMIMFIISSIFFSLIGWIPTDFIWVILVGSGLLVARFISQFGEGV